MPADQKSFGDGNASSTARSQQSKQQSSDSYTRSAATDFSSIFRIPPPMKRLFDRFPLVTYPPNELPVRPKQQNTTFETEDVLYVFCTEEDAQNGRPSFNPGCLRWQTYLKFNKIPFRIRPSNNHSSPSGALPFLLSASQEASQRECPPITTNEFSAHFQIPSPTAAQHTSPQVALQLTLLNHPIRLSYLHALYIHQSTFYNFTFPRYVKPATDFSLVQAALCHPLRLAARQEIASHYDTPTTSSLWLTDREQVVEQLYRDAEEAWEALGALLGDSQWFSGEVEPGWLDASVFAYTYVVRLVMDEGVHEGPVKRLDEAVKKNENLVRHRERILEVYDR